MKISLKQPDILNDLKQRGLPLEAVRAYKIGWLPENINETGDTWDLKKKKISGFLRVLLFPI